jgi:hypothetical protein
VLVVGVLAVGGVTVGVAGSDAIGVGVVVVGLLSFVYLLLTLSFYAQVVILSFHKLLSTCVVPLSAVGAGVASGGVAVGGVVVGELVVCEVAGGGVTLGGAI